MSENEILRRLDDLGRRVADVAERLGRIESTLASGHDVHEKLAHEVEARRRLGDQTEWLIELLGDARKELERLRSTPDGAS